MKALYMAEDLIIRQMSEMDISPVCKASGDTSAQAMEYLTEQMREQQEGECIGLLAVCGGNIAGYVFLYYRCKWGGLGGKGVPGIVDLIVFEEFRGRKIAARLLEVAEKIAAEYHDSVYLDVCLDSAHGMALRLYVKRGYIPDGKGAYYQEKVLPVGACCKNDEQLTLCLVKKLR